MTDDDSSAPFERDGQIDKPGIIGARWWQKGLIETPDPITRRKALSTVLVVGVALAGFGALIALVANAASDDYKTEPRPSLDMQREFGWNFGAATENITFDGISTLSFDPSNLTRMADDFAPKSPKYLPWWSPTLFQSPTAMPKQNPSGDPVASFVPLKQVLRPMSIPSMNEAFRQGRVLAALLGSSDAGNRVAVIVDLQGPESVAFAAGMAAGYDPVFLFENWPHPRGVVKAHRTLAAAAFYQPLFVRAKSTRSANAPPVFVLDRDRLASYTDENTQFDNRWVARMPSAKALRALGRDRVLYVTTFESDANEMDDLNDDFLGFSAGGIDVRMIGAQAFFPCSSAPGAETEQDAGCYYGGSSDTHGWFFVDYPWGTPPAAGKRAPALSTGAREWRPKPRVTQFSSGKAAADSSVRTRPTNFGAVPVVLAVGTGVILGAKLSRSGSWNRSSGGWGG